MRVLAVEDDPVFRRLARTLLETSPEGPVATTEADTLQGGLDALRLGRIDLVLLDLELPDGRGAETFMRVRAAAPELPIVILTGSEADHGAAARAIREGAQDYLPKASLNGEALARSLRYAVERKRIELRLVSTIQELQRSNRALEDFAAVVGHDLKAPLRAITSFGQFLMEDLEAGRMAEARASAERMRERATQLSRLVDDVLASAKAGARPASTKHDVAALVEEVVAALPVPAGFTVDVDPHLAEFRTHGRLLQRVVQSLLSNAIQHAAHPGGHVRISAQDLVRALLFVVEDDGPGITPEAQAHLFERFRPGAAATSGTGLGLSIVRDLVESQGGCVAIESDAGHGTRVLFTWPKDAAAAAATGA